MPVSGTFPTNPPKYGFVIVALPLILPIAAVGFALTLPSMIPFIVTGAPFVLPGVVYKQLKKKLAKKPTIDLTPAPVS